MDTSLFDHFKTHFSAHRFCAKPLNGFNEWCQAATVVDIHSFGCRPFFLIFACSLLFFFNVFFFRSSELNPHETLLHFAARRGLCQVANFLLQQSGAREALRLANREGHTPSAIAALRGHEHLHQLLKKSVLRAKVCFHFTVRVNSVQKLRENNFVM